MVSFTLSSAFVSLLMVMGTLGHQLVDDDVVKRQEVETTFIPRVNMTITSTIFFPQVTTLSVVTPEAGEPSAIVTNYTTIGVVSVIGPQNVSVEASTYSMPSNNNYTFSATATGAGSNYTASSSSTLANSTDIPNSPDDSGNSATGFSRPHGAIVALGLMASGLAFVNL